MFKVGDSVIANGYLPGVVTQVDVGYRIQNVPGGTETFWAEENLQLISPEPKFPFFSQVVLVRGHRNAPPLTEPIEATIIGLTYDDEDKSFMYKIKTATSKEWVGEDCLRGKKR